MHINVKNRNITIPKNMNASVPNNSNTNDTNIET